MVQAAVTQAPGVSVIREADFRRVLHQRSAPDAAIPLYRVKAGDSISAVAERDCHGQAKDWTGIFAASRVQHLTGANANLITAGQELAVDCKYLPSQLKYAGQVHAVAASTTTSPAASVSGRHDRFDGHHGDCGDGDGDGMDAPCSAIFSHAVTATPAPQRHVLVRAAGSFGSVSPGSFSGMERCIINAESGGNSQVMNASGHYGLFQFSASTWAGHGGNPASFGHASVAEQEAVFAQTVRDDGYIDWTPYDGC